MYIRKTGTRRSPDGKAYPSFRIVTSERVQGKVKQRTLLNIGSCFELQPDLWGALCSRIDDMLAGRLSLIQPNPLIEGYAQEFAARIIAENASPAPETPKTDTEYIEVDPNSLAMLRPRSVGVEHVALHAAHEIQLPNILEKAGLKPNEVQMALATVTARMAKPGSEEATFHWLTQHSALGELLDMDFSVKSVMSLHRISDALVQRREYIENSLFSQISSIFSLTATVTLYDLTNTYFEGKASQNPKAMRGFSKEKRFDCPLVTLGLVLDGSGFIRKSKVFAGNIAEAQTIQDILEKLDAPASALVVMDRGIATKATLEWLVNAGYRYVVANRERTRIFDFSKAQTIQTAKEQDIQIYREQNEEGTEACLYCYSPQREMKEQAIAKRFFEKFEAGLRQLAENLHKSRSRKSKDEIIKRLGRLTEKCHGIGRHYTVTVADNAAEKDADAPLLATSITFEKKPIKGSLVTHPGVYCIKTNDLSLGAEELWKTYTMLTDLESVFRSLKSELGLRPVYHRKEERAEGHLFITVLAYQCVQFLRNTLKGHGINDSWQTLRATLCSHHRVTATFRQRNGATLHIRKPSEAEAGHQRIYDALHITHAPGGTKRHTVYTSEE
jgi:transposase